MGHSGDFSGPKSINQNESNMDNEIIMIKKLETNSKRGPFSMFLGRKLKNCRQILSEDFFLEITRFSPRELNFVGQNWVVKLPCATLG